MPLADHAEVLWERIERRTSDGPVIFAELGQCVEWNGARDKRGYGRMKTPGTGLRFVHRVAYELAHGPILPGMSIDHRCSNHSCVRPSHLRQVTVKQNQEHRESLSKRNTSGVSGVTLHKPSGRWRVRIKHHGVSIHGGYFDTLADAAAAARALRAKLHPYSDRNLGE